MERRGNNTWLVAVLAVAVGFLVALLIFGGDDNENTSATVDQTSATTTTQVGTGTGTTTANTGASTTSTTTTQPGTATQTPDTSVGACIGRWNLATNRGNQTFIVNLMSQQAIRVNVGQTSDVPPKCLITIVANNGDAYVFPEGGGGTYPYARAPGKTSSSGIPAAQKTSNALEQGDGTLKPR